MRKTFAAAVGVAAVASLTIPTLSTAAAGDGGSVTAAQQDALDLGIQVAPKASDLAARKATGKATSKAGGAALSPNPYLANLPSVTDADYFTWNKRMHAKAEQRADSAKLSANRREAASAAASALPPAFVHDEEEPAGSAGSNDTAPNAEPIAEFGTANSRNNRVRILGELANLSGPAARTITTAEDQGSIPLATATGITGAGAVKTTSVLGDGPHGNPPGDDTNDFDFYKVDVAAGNSITANTEGSAATTDTIIAVYDAEGTALAADDDSGTGTSSNLSYTPEAPGTYYVLVAGYSLAGPLPEDPFDSGSGFGGADDGAYNLAISVQQVDADFYSVRLRPGDTVGAVGNGGATGLAVTTPSGERRVGGVGTDASSLYPPTSPLPGGGNTTIAYVAEEAGWYAVEVTGAVGAYDVTVEGYRPGAELDRTARTQTVLLDFDPGRVNAATWGSLSGVVDVSPFSSFVPKWGIARADARKVENRVVDTVRANLQAELQSSGLNPDVNVEVLNARTNADLIGKENVSRIYVAGTIAETGISTIGIAQYIDPGNYGHEDEAIVLLDVLSAAAGPISSLNTFMNASSDRVRFVSAAVGNVVAHEVGHTIGSYHTDNADEIGNMMDSGGANFAFNLYGVGPDNVGGTADDTNVRFLTDTYTPVEGFTGLENTLNVSAWAYSGR
ncbi:pre-peptidase C-terminal domain-containing protein [Nocardioides sp. LHG3406-4]|uniref:pre-peptidase C-terminal domain-containing protein n=1 Tax=Nocardioides sp. LHG3406-4 TaxID=2804575 RepID=UPI003CFA7BA4